MNLDRLIATLEELSLQASKAAVGLREQADGAPEVAPIQADHVVWNPSKDELLTEIAKVPVKYPYLVPRFTVEWEVLRFMAGARLSKLVADGIYRGRTAEDKGYSWVAEQWGVSNSVARVFLTQPGRVMSPEVLLRVVEWLGCTLDEFVTKEGEDD